MGLGMFDTTGSPLKMGFDHFFGYNCQRHAHSYFPKYLYAMPSALSWTADLRPKPDC